jgi:hypothetical protein
MPTACNCSFTDCLRGGQPPSVSGADALAACEIGIAATHPYQTGRPISLSELLDRGGESDANT